MLKFEALNSLEFQSPDEAEDSDDEPECSLPISHFSGISNSVLSSSIRKPAADYQSDSEESFASLHSDDVEPSDDDDKAKINESDANKQ